ncbi:MAG TPA: YiiX/YebB-like N1pC/P60 family cysteine hydrolase [Lacunisphaera sp.]|nr:YiiX/YebB-like N1pC/P60 family cysteine hydrolase [Lacunisphaera sp.]
MHRRGFLLIALLGFQWGAASATPTPAPAGEPSPLETSASEVIRLRHGMQAITAYLATQPQLFPAKRGEEKLLPREDKEAVWGAWQRFLDIAIALEALESAHRPWTTVEPSSRTEHTLVGHAAFLAQYRGALEFINRADKNPALDKVLNEPVPELGLPGGTYASLKLHFLNVAIATEFAARRAVASNLKPTGLSDLMKAIDEDSDALWRAGRGSGVKLTARNAWKVLQRTASSAWLPVQAGVSEWMGDTKVYRPHRDLILPAQIEAIAGRFEPGDILLERREWFLSNIGLPGYWPHAALYMGTPEERRRYFDTPEIRAWLATENAASGELEAMIAAREPRAYATAVAADPAGHAPRVIEAMSEGVSFTTLEHSASCDALVVLRPRVPRLEKARALLRAFHYGGRPYDFDFDFATDSSLVCTELVYKAYEPATGFGGVRFVPGKVLGRLVLPANEIARQFDDEHGKPSQQFDFVLFLDGSERTKQAMEATLDDFRQSWRRPKWHVITADRAPPST